MNSRHTAYSVDQDSLEECSECGHQHFDPRASDYMTCPVPECGCPMNPALPEPEQDYCPCDHCREQGTCLGCTSGACP